MSNTNVYITSNNAWTLLGSGPLMFQPLSGKTRWWVSDSIPGSFTNAYSTDVTHDLQSIISTNSTSNVWVCTLSSSNGYVVAFGNTLATPVVKPVNLNSGSTNFKKSFNSDLVGALL